MVYFNPASTALILVDLQSSIVPMAKAPRSGDDVVRGAKVLANRFRAAYAPVVLVHVAFARSEMPSQNVDEPSIPAEGTPAAFDALVPGLREVGDIVVLKHNWGAFTGTDLDLQLRRRGCQTVVIGGVATNFGVESTARSAWELSYDVVIAEDVTATSSEEMHTFSTKNILPRLSRVLASEEIQFKAK